MKLQEMQSSFGFIKQPVRNITGTVSLQFDEALLRYLEEDRSIR